MGELRDINVYGADNDGMLVDGNVLIEDNTDSDFEVEYIRDMREDSLIGLDDDNDKAFNLKYINIKNIAIVKRIRKNKNVDDLKKSIKSTGLINPIVVAPSATEGIYVLLDGYRRLLVCAMLGKEEVPCIINNRVSTPEIPILEALYNHKKQYTMKEIVDYIDFLEKQKGIMSASMIEYLLQLNSGEYTKLKDILEDGDDEIVSRLMDGEYTIEQAFKKLEQRRKKESAETKDIKKAEKVYSGDVEETKVDIIEGTGEEVEGNIELTAEELEGLSFNASEFEDSLEGDSLEDMIEEGKNIEGFEPHKQDPEEREILDKALRKAVLARDNNTCMCCKLSGQEYTEVLDVHHIHMVYLGGTDDIDNLITLCTVCHKLVHLYGRGELYMRPLEDMTEQEREKFKRIIKLGNVIRKGLALRGIKKEQLKKIDKAETIGRTRPGKGQIAD
ncbi:MAG: ParB N-terminal domain-containing protein [Candidatus Anstonellales archaeon]